jgi:hypothetical protein
MSEQPANYGTTHINNVWRQTVAAIKAEAMAEQAPCVEKWLTFTLIDGRWDVQLWGKGYQPVDAKVYLVKIPVPPELVGPVIQASIEPVKE